MDKIKIISIIGPTASGKTSLSIAVAKKYNGEIVSADSMQIYNDISAVIVSISSCTIIVLGSISDKSNLLG